MPKQQNPNYSYGCMCMCCAASSPCRSARLPLSIPGNICIHCVTGTACTTLDCTFSQALFKKPGFVQGVGARAPTKPAAALCGCIIFPPLLNCTCAIWSMQTTLSSIQSHSVEIVVYLHHQLSHDTVMVYLPQEPEETWARFPAGKNQHD